MKVTPVTPARGDATFDAILRDDPASRPVDRLPHAPDLDACARVAADVVNTRYPRARVVKLLARHNEKIGNPAGAALAARLEDPKSLVVVTGQQPGLFGGPLLVFAKIAGALGLARRLEERLGVPVVPLFWNHSEDHDLEEVNRVAWHGGSSIHRDKAPLRDRGTSLDELRIDAEVVDWARAAIAAAGSEPADVDAWLPRDEERFPEWTSRVVRAVFGDSPIVHAEPFVIRSLLGPSFSEWTAAWKPLDDAVRAGISAVASSGMTPQIVPDAPGHLFMRDEKGRRRKLRRTDTGWSWDGAEGLPDDADAWIADQAANYPERFSCTALLRPLAQQAALPVVAHVNGPAETAYFAQLPEVFTVSGLTVPVVFPRPTLTILAARHAGLASRLAIDEGTLVGPVASWPEPQPGAKGPGVGFDGLRDAIAEWERTLTDAAPDDGVRRSVGGWSKKVADATARLEKSFDKAEEQRSGAGRAARHRLAEWVWPTGRPQERVLGPLGLFRGRDPGSLGDILGSLDPLDFRHHVVTLDPEDSGT